MREPTTFTRRAAAALPLAALFAAASAGPAAAAGTDPVLQQIAQHQDLRIAISETSGADDDPEYVQACADEEAAIQALGEAIPTTIAGAAALLAYMAEVEGVFADPGSPLLRAVLSVVEGLRAMNGART